MSARARRSRPIGLQAEAAAEHYLLGQGYHVLARNHHCREGEIDLIAERDDWLIFVEVKARKPSSRVDAVTSVTPSKQRKIVRAAFDFIRENAFEDRAMRFDIIAITLQRGRPDTAPVTTHLEGAFDASVLDAERPA
jgi:putative endonuclease